MNLEMVITALGAFAHPAVEFDFINRDFDAKVKIKGVHTEGDAKALDKAISVACITFIE